jgi:hypothetical protein
MDKDIKDYREKYKNCRWCKHFFYKTRLQWSWEECELSETRCEHFHWLRAKFCKYYRVREEDK